MILYMKYDKGKKQTDVVLVDGSRMIIKHVVPYIIDRLCQMYACTYEGRKRAIAKALGITQKIPILLSEQEGDFFFPVTSIRRDQTYWINYHYIEKVKRLADDCMILLGGSTLLLPVDSRTVKKQMNRCVRYLAYLDELKHRYTWNRLAIEMNPKCYRPQEADEKILAL